MLQIENATILTAIIRNFIDIKSGYVKGAMNGKPF